MRLARVVEEQERKRPEGNGGDEPQVAVARPSMPERASRTSWWGRPKVPPGVSLAMDWAIARPISPALTLLCCGEAPLQTLQSGRYRFAARSKEITYGLRARWRDSKALVFRSTASMEHVS